MASVVLKNIQTILSGNIQNPIIEGDAIQVVDGLIKEVGRLSDMEIEEGCNHAYPVDTYRSKRQSPILHNQ